MCLIRLYLFACFTCLDKLQRVQIELSCVVIKILELNMYDYGYTICILKMYEKMIRSENILSIKRK